MSDVPILKAMMTRDVYTKYFPVLSRLTNKQKETTNILQTIAEYYKRYDHDTINVDELKALFNYLNPQVQSKEIVEIMFAQMKSVEIDTPELLIDILNGTVERHIMTQIGNVVNEVILNLKPTGIGQIEKLIEKFHDISESVQEVEHDVCLLSLPELLINNASDGLRWSLNFLNDIFGPIKHSTLGHIFARPEVGKSSMALNQLCCFAVQLRNTDRSLLYLNNEEDIRQIKLRAHSAMLDKSLPWLESNSIEGEKLWIEKGGDNIKFIGGVQHIIQVQTYMDVFKPRVVVIDQGPKVNITGNEEGVARLQKLYGAYRKLGVDYEASMITLGQADNASDGRKILHLNNMDQSKTAIPGELDWCLAIGSIYDRGYEAMRWLNACKNKLTGKSGNDSVTFDKEVCRYRDLK